MNNPSDTVALVKQIVEFIAEHAQCESAFLTPHPTHSVNATALLDCLVEISGVSKDQIGAWVDVIADRKEGA
jgi:hypothetical protein